MQVILTRLSNNSFLPAHNSDYDKLKRIKPGDIVQCEIKKPRNLKFHRKFFALMNMVYDNQEIFESLDDLRYFLTMKAGFNKRVMTNKGEMILPKSIRFSKMDEHEFSELYDRILDVIVLEFDFNKELIIENIENFY